MQNIKNSDMRKLILVSGLLMVSFSSLAQFPLSRDFMNQSTKYKVKGLNGWQVNQKIGIGSMETSRIRRGWDFTASLQYTKFRMRPEEILLSVFDIRTSHQENYQHNRFQYSLSNGNDEMEVYATEKFNENQLVYKSSNPFVGSASITRKYEYAFTAAMVPLGAGEVKPWSLVLINSYDPGKDTVRKIGDRSYVEEEGYLTNGSDYFTIRPLRIGSYRNRKGKEIKILGGPLLAGYAIEKNGAPAAMIDILDNEVWISETSSAKEKLLMASASTAILLKRFQEVEKDRANSQ